jgi:hypothetical protein
MTSNKAAIDSLKLGQFSETCPVMFMLADGMLSYFNFPKMTVIDQLLTEHAIVDFQLYTNTQRFLATVHSTQQLKVFLL